MPQPVDDDLVFYYPSTPDRPARLSRRPLSTEQQEMQAHDAWNGCREQCPARLSLRAAFPVLAEPAGSQPEVRRHLHALVDALESGAARRQLHALVDELNEQQARAAVGRIRRPRQALDELGFSF